MDECRFHDTTHGDFPCQQAQDAGSAEPLDSIVFTPEITAFFVDGRPEWQNVEFVSNGIGYYAQENTGYAQVFSTRIQKCEESIKFLCIFIKCMILFLQVLEMKTLVFVKKTPIRR